MSGNYHGGGGHEGRLTTAVDTDRDAVFAVWILVGDRGDAAGIRRILRALQEEVVLLLLQGEGLTAVRTRDDVDAIMAHLAPVSDIAEEPFGAKVLVDLVNERFGVG